MAEMTPATNFVFSPKGPYSLAASTRFLEGFAPAAYDAESAANLEMAFCVDGYWDPVAVRVHEETGAVHGTVHGGDTLAPAVIAAAVEQVGRILSLDIDGRAFPDIARHDPVVAQLQSRYPGLRPVCFWSPYEAAAWSVIGQRIRIVQAAAIKARITAEHGETIDVGGRMVRAFPNPAKLAQLSTVNGLSETKLQRLRGIAEAALGGTLGAARLRSLPRSQALEELIAIPGIGPFSAELILLRGAGDPDFTPTAEPRLARAMAIAYDMKAPPSAADIAEISEVWKPYRTWVALLLRTMLEDETHEIAGQAITRTPGL
jgi:DNA-3-methyladenine glycosylase II